VISHVTALAGDNTRFVEHETTRVGLYGDCNGADVETRHHLIFLPTNVDDAGDTSDRSALSAAASVFTRVWVVSSGANAIILDDPTQATAHIATSATIAAAVTVNQLLHGQGQQLLRADRPRGLDAASCRPRPARAASALVIDGVDHASVAPVEGVLLLDTLKDLVDLSVGGRFLQIIDTSIWKSRGDTCARRGRLE